jgi:chromosome segregation ATPase
MEIKTRYIILAIVLLFIIGLVVGFRLKNISLLLQDSKKQIQNLKEQNLTLSKQSGGQELLINDLNSNTEKILSELRLSKEQINALRNSLNTKSELLAEYETEIQALEQQVDQLTNQLLEQKNQLTELSEESKNLLKATRLQKIKTGAIAGAIGVGVGAIVGIVIYVKIKDLLD